ncbi:MAG TPA: fructosamine kinase family protein [Burkholderiales bacterium]|jgi:fructosamine-3-kinase
MAFTPDLVVAIETAVSTAVGPFHLQRTAPAPGGCIHRCYVLEGAGQRFFAKINDSSQSDNFAAEADGLEALAAAGARVPAPICRGEAGADAFLVLEYLDLRGKGDYAALGRALAALHSIEREDYGWHRDNYIGRTPQLNPRSLSWADFWSQARVAPQLDLARRNRLGENLIRKGERLAAMVPRLLAGHAPAASLLHGDIWSGNAGFLADGTPVLFDPAVYLGDREADLAMTELFGGYPQVFYSAYREAAPLDQSYAVRKTLYNLYHVLNHANLFGGGYAPQAERMMERLLAESR